MRATLVVDGNNVVGAAADGWWRDRPAAVRRLLGRLRCYGRGRPERIVLVLDVRQADLPEGTHDGIDVRYPDRPGRDAADGRIVELLEELAAGDPAPDAVTVVSSDRALAGAARHRGTAVIGAGAFLARLRDAGC
ncbi:MAG TPA: NYN domain-containing protein [Acidimicrobiales bacterium]